MIGYFPTIQPEELLYSAYARYASRAAFGRTRDAHVDLFGIAKGTASVEFPSRIDTFLERLPTPHHYCASRLIEEHTTLPYHRCALLTERYERVVGCMRSKTPDKFTQPGGLVTGGTSVVVPTRFHFCPDCFEEDMARAGGGPAWRRVHQCPGVFVCPSHSSPLLVSSHLRTERINPLRFSALSGEDLRSAKRIGAPRSDPAFLLSIAEQTQWLLTSPATIGGRLLLHRGIRRAVSLEGWFEGRGSLRNGALKIQPVADALLSHVGSAFLKATGTGLQSNRRGNATWLAVLLRSSESRMEAPPGTHPLKVLLAVSALGLTIQQLYELAHHEPDTYDLLLEARQSKRRADCLPRRPRGHRMGWPKGFEERLRALIADKNASLSSMIRALGAAGPTIKLRAHALGIARPEWDIPQSNARGGPRKHRIYPSIDEYRARMLDAIAQNPDATRADLQQLANGTYTVLRKRDWEWLENALPPRRPRRGPGRYVDWAARDEEVSIEATVLIGQLRADPQSPKITRTLVLHRLEKRFSVFSYRRLPNTRRVAETAAESCVQFRERRLRGAIEHFQNLGEATTKFELFRWAKSDRQGEGEGHELFDRLMTEYGAVCENRTIFFPKKPRTLKKASKG